MRINQRRKRTFAGLALALAVTTMAAVPARAADHYTTSVTYTIPDTYNIIIPGSVQLGESSGMTARIGAENVNISSGKEVQVKVSNGITGGNVMLSNGSDAIYLRVSLTSGGSGIGSDAVVARFQGQNDNPVSGTGTLYFHLGQSGKPAGDYKGTIVFAVSLVDTN